MSYASRELSTSAALAERSDLTAYVLSIASLTANASFVVPGRGCWSGVSGIVAINSFCLVFSDLVFLASRSLVYLRVLMVGVYEEIT